MYILHYQPIDVVESFKHLGHVITSHLEDASDITARRYDLIGQVNNMLCYFRKLTSDVKCRLFRSYCTSFYGCELWSLATSNIEDFCTSWRKGVRSVWNLPQSTHCYLLPLICHCLPVVDEICRRSINFVRACLSHESDLIRQIASYGVYLARSESPLGHNVLFCVERYQSSINSILSESLNNIINLQYQSTVDITQLQTASFLSELIDIRDRWHTYSNNFILSKDELIDIISYICTM